MKIKNSLVTAAAVCGLFLTVQSGFAQGSLTPPGPPAPTMKSLDQIEPRTIVNAANTPGDGSTVLFIINKPGSYYLTTNIGGVSGESGIAITANNVTLDLNGFALQGNFQGIYIPNAQTNVTVRNGIISGGGANGVYSVSSLSVNQVFEHLNVSFNNYSGIYLDGDGVVRDCNSQNNHDYGIACDGSGILFGCTANHNIGAGIYINGGIVSCCTADNNDQIGIAVYSGTVSCCTANNNGETGIESYADAIISGCFAQDNIYDGIDSAGLVSGCFAQNNGIYGIGIYAGTVSGCHAVNNFYSGIYVGTSGSEVIGNNCSGNNTGGSAYQFNILLAANNNRVEDNHVVTISGYPGIEVYSGYSNNIIIKNSVIGNGVNNFSYPAGNDVGPIGTAATATSPWANISH